VGFLTEYSFIFFGVSDIRIGSPSSQEPLFFNNNLRAENRSSTWYSIPRLRTVFGIRSDMSIPVSKFSI
jgi:hypothetical protein